MDWEVAWRNIFKASKNPNHQLIHFKLSHRAYWTPLSRFHAKLTSNPNCELCSLGVPGSLKHMVWDCPGVYSFWKRVTSILSKLIGKDIPLQPILLLLNDDSQLQLSEKQRKIMFAGLTAAKKLIVQRWMPPYTLHSRKWLFYFHDIVMMELSTSRIHNAKASTIQIWENLANNISELLNV